MQEAQAQVTLLVRAFEEVDRQGRILSHEQRAAATRRAVMVTTLDGATLEDTGETRAPNEETVIRRARLLHSVLVRRIPALQQVADFARLRSLLGPALVAVGFIVGLSTQTLGPSQRVNLLAFPLLALLGWNLISYVAMAATALLRWFLRRRHEQQDNGGRRRVVTGLAGWVVRFALWRSRHSLQKQGERTPEQSRIIGRAVTRFCGLWHRLTQSLLEARVRRRLHLMAIALACGVVLGMYLRGLAFEYRVQWESTFLDVDQVQALLGFVLGPACRLLGVQLPDVAPLRGPSGNGQAALWIHLWAVTAGWFVIIPRAVLAGIEAWRSWRLKADLGIDLQDGYYRRILASWRGARKRVDIAPYSYSLPLRAKEQLKALLYDYFGTRANIRVLNKLEYGARADELMSARLAADAADEVFAEAYIVVLFNLAQAPETEVHGDFLEQLKAQVDLNRDRVLVITDVTSYRSYTGAGPRLQERIRAWDRVVGEAGLSAVPLEPDTAVFDPQQRDERLDLVRRALWPEAHSAEAI